MTIPAKQQARIYAHGYSAGFYAGDRYFAGMSSLPPAARADLLLIDKLMSMLPVYNFTWPDEYKAVWFSTVERLSEWRRDLLRESEQYPIGYSLRLSTHDAMAEINAAADRALEELRNA